MAREPIVGFEWGGWGVLVGTPAFRLATVRLATLIGPKSFDERTEVAH
jgi:hypothetical protein